MPGLQPIKPGKARSGPWAPASSHLPLQNIPISIIRAGNRGSERVSPTPEATPQEMEKLQSQPRSAFCPSPRAHSASLPPVLSPRGPGRERGGSWPSEATGCEATGCAWQARSAGPHRRTGRTNEPAGGEKQDHGRLRWRRTDFSTAKGSSLAFSTQFLPWPSIAALEGC